MIRSQTFWILLTSLLTSCADPYGSGGRTSWSMGTPGSQQSLFSDGSFGCTARANRAWVGLGESYSVTVTAYNANGPVELLGAQSTPMANGLVFTASYTTNHGRDIYYYPTIFISDGERTASCQYGITIRGHSTRRL